jgi:hypothetical protein
MASKLNMLYEISNYNFLLTTPNKGKIQLKNITGDIKLYLISI